MLNNIDLEEIKNIAISAGDAAMKIYNNSFEIEYKNDNSPLTKADKEANKIICTSLSQLYKEIPILSEENKTIPYQIRKKWNYYWCIDPIDGTKEFIKKNGEFTINIALIFNETPILGVVYAPVLKNIYYAKQKYGAFKNGKKLPLQKENKKLIIVASKSHLSPETEEFIDSIQTNKEKKLLSIGSSLKLCLVAEGSADIYPRLAPTMEWDTAAAHAIVLEAGKEVLQFQNNKKLLYNKENLLNPWFIVK